MTTQELLSWVIAHGYVLMFIVMCIEGPIAAVVSAFAAAMGYFSLPIVLILSILGDVVPDSAYYFLGYLGRQKCINIICKIFHISNKHIEETEKLVHKHSVKAIVAIKLTPILPFFGFAMLGSMHTPFKKVFTAVVLISSLRSIFLIILGYYFGLYLDIINQYIGRIGTIMGIIICVSGILFLTKILLQKFAEKADSSLIK